MFNPNLAKIFQPAHLTVVVCYDRDCHQNLYDNLYCDLSDDDADFFEVPLNPDFNNVDEPYSLTDDISGALQDEFGGALTPAYLLVDLAKTVPHYNQPDHRDELATALCATSTLVQNQKTGMVMIVTLDDAAASAAKLADYLNHNGASNFTIFAMADKNPSLLTYANGPQQGQQLDLDSFPNA